MLDAETKVAETPGDHKEELRLWLRLLTCTTLIEGEAMLAVSELMDYDFEAHATIPAEGPLDEERFEKIFHYGDGLRFVRALRDAGGWDGVSEAFQDPPRTTGEVYHPERYLEQRRDEPPGLRLCQKTRASGEYGLSLWLSREEDTRPLAGERSLAVTVGKPLRSKGRASRERQGQRYNLSLCTGLRGRPVWVSGGDPDIRARKPRGRARKKARGGGRGGDRR